MALEQGEEAVTMFREQGNPHWLSTALTLVSLALVETEVMVKAKNYLLEALTIADEIQSLANILDTLVPLAEILAFEGEIEQAVTVLSFATQHPRTKASFRHRAEPILEKLKQTLDESVWDEYYTRGTEEILENIVQMWLV